MKDSKVKSKRWKKLIVKYIRANRNIHLRRIDMRNTAFVICVSDRLTANACRKQYRFSHSTRHAALTLASVKKAEESRDLSCRRRRCHPWAGHSVSAKKRVDFPRRRPLHRGRRSFDRSKRCARSFNGIYFPDRSFYRSHFLSVTFPLRRKLPIK